MKKITYLSMVINMKYKAIFVILLILLSGCQTKETDLSQKEAALVIVVQDTISGLTKALTGPVAENNLEEVNLILKDYFSGAGLEPRLAVTYAGVTNNQGIILAAYPKTNAIGSDFSKYGVMAKVLQNRGIYQERLFMDNYPEIWVLCAPLMNHGKVVGTVWLALDAEDVRTTWKMSTEVFLRINFNK